MGLGEAGRQLAAEIASRIHTGDLFGAVKAMASRCGVKPPDKKDEETTIELMQSYMHGLLNAGAFTEAAQMLWTPTQFNPNPASTQEVWKLFDEADTGLIMGAAKMSKSFSMGVRLFLEWVRDPEFTSIRVLGPSEDHLEQNLFSHLVSLHQHATLPMPGKVGNLFIGLNRRDQL